MESDKRDVRVTPDLTLKHVLERSKLWGHLRLLDGDDVYLIKHVEGEMTNSAREFLLRGGPVED